MFFLSRNKVANTKRPWDVFCHPLLKLWPLVHDGFAPGWPWRFKNVTFLVFAKFWPFKMMWSQMNIIKYSPSWWFQICFMFIPYLGKISNLTNIFQMGWNHQPEPVSHSMISLELFVSYHWWLSQIRYESEILLEYLVCFLEEWDWELGSSCLFQFQNESQRRPEDEKD